LTTIFTVLILSALLVSSLLAQEEDTPVEAPAPTIAPTEIPTDIPTPIVAPTEVPTEVPTATPAPTDPPTETPTEVPTVTSTPVPTATPTEEPARVESSEIVVLGIQPTELTQGVGGTLTVSGANFTSSTSVSLNGTIMLPVTSISPDTLVVSVGADVPAGVYTVEVSDPVGGTVTAASTLTITEPATTPQLVVIQNEPSQITSGQSGNLSIMGANFTENTTVRLVGFGFLSTTFVNSGALTAILPSTLPAGQYSVEVSDPTYGTATAPNTLRVVAASVAATATATSTPVPGQPMLVVRSFSASPASIYPGGTTQFTFEVVNVGNRTAEGIAISLGNSDFAPASGQASVTLPDLSTSETYTVTLSVIAPADAAEGPVNIPVVLSSYDFSGETYTNTAKLSVTILAEADYESQVVLDSYQVTPSATLPGDTVNIQALFVNTGNDIASQVLVQLDTASTILIAGSEGNSFPIGDMQPGARAAIAMPLVVANDAPSGVQTQSFTISYMQDGETRQTSASISLSVEPVVQESPVLLLASYDAGQDETLQPGQQFTYTMNIQNAGNVDVSNLLVTFGQAQTSASEDAASTATSTSITFAPMGSGDTVFLGDLPAGETATLSQDFIVNDDVSSGVYMLSMNLQYQLADGTVAEKSLNASLVVVVPPRLRITLTEALEDPLTVGETYTASLEITNLGSSDVALTQMRVTGDNVTITEGAETLFNPLQSDDDTSVDISLAAERDGVYTIMVALDYLDDLNQTRTYATAFSGEVEEATQPQMPVMPFALPSETTQDENLLGRLLLGFLGFGG
jgi:hypothetical protein